MALAHQPHGESELQGEPTGMRAWEDGTSKCRFVVKRIRIDLSA